MISSKKIVTVFLTLTLLLALPLLVGAEENPLEFNLESILVVDSKMATDDSKIVSIKAKDKINAGQYNSVTDLLKDVPGIIVQTGSQSGTTVSLRGMSNERLLVALNGNVIENQGGLMRGRALEWDAIPVTNVQKIEIIRGANSAVYGGTWGGVINIVTVQKPGENKTSLKYSYGKYNDRKYSLSNQGNSDDGKISWTVTGNKRDADGFYRNNWTDMKDVNLNLSYNLTEQKKLSFLWTNMDKKEGIIVGNGPKSNNGYNDAYPIVPDAPTTGGAYKDPNNRWLDDSYRQWKTNNYALNYDDDNQKLGIYKNTQHRTEYFRTKNQPNLNLSWESDIDNYGYNYKKTVKFKDHRIVYGSDYKKMDYDLTSSKTNLKTDLNGLFVQDNWQVTDKTTIGLGARYDYYKLDMDVDPANAQKSRDETKSQLSPKFSATYKVGNNESVYSSISKVFRTPTLSDYYRWSGNYYDPNGSHYNSYKTNVLKDPNFTLTQWQQMVGFLKPEDGVSYELGWQKQFNSQFNLRVTGYMNDINNYVTTYSAPGTGGYPTTYNMDNAKIKGLELATDYQLSDKFALVSNYTHQKATKTGDKFDPTGTTVTNLPKNTVNFGLRYDSHKGFRGALDTRYRSRITNSSSVLGGYSITDLALSYTKHDKTINLAINNIFDKEYQENSGFPMPGTTYSLSYQYAF